MKVILNQQQYNNLKSQRDELYPHLNLTSFIHTKFNNHVRLRHRYHRGGPAVTMASGDMYQVTLDIDDIACDNPDITLILLAI